MTFVFKFLFFSLRIQLLTDLEDDVGLAYAGGLLTLSLLESREFRPRRADTRGCDILLSRDESREARPRDVTFERL